jgi:hypothetical protein
MSLRRIQLLGIVYALKAASWSQDYCSGNDRPRQTPTTNLVDTRDTGNVRFPETVLEFSDASQSPLLGFTPAKLLTLTHGKTADTCARILFEQSQDSAPSPPTFLQQRFDLCDRGLG